MTKTLTHYDYRHTPQLSIRSLDRALARVARRHAAGIDGVRPASFRAGNGGGPVAVAKLRGAEIQMISGWLGFGRYRFMKARLHEQPKADDTVRVQAIPSVRDATVLAATMFELSHAWKKIPPQIVGGRPGGSVHDAIKTVQQFVAQPGGWIYRFDISKAFRRASFEGAIDALGYLTLRYDLLNLLLRWRQRQNRQQFEGLIEGTCVAPLLLAALLGVHLVPRLRQITPSFVIWFDDGLVWAPDQHAALEARDVIDETFAELGLEVHPGKTVGPIFDAPGSRASWKFLGYEWDRGSVRPTDENWLGLLQAIKEQVAAHTPESIPGIVRGWGHFYRLTDLAGDLADLDREIASLLKGKPWAQAVPRLVDVVKEGEVGARSRVGLAIGKGKKFRQPKPLVPWEPLESSKTATPRVATHGDNGVSNTRPACGA